MIELVLSLFPGADLLGQGFQLEGYCVVRGPDILLGQDIADWVLPPPHSFGGLIAGPPCQDFSRARRRPPTGYGVIMLQHLHHVISVSQPKWFLVECVPGVPDLVVAGWSHQRLLLTAAECGCDQLRNRCLQFASLDGSRLLLNRQLMAR